MEDVNELIELFEIVNEIFINNDRYLLDKEVNERCICAALAMELNDYIKHNETKYKNYNVDVEYNRNKNHKKELDGKNIITDFIMHRRGEKENLIILEMKKSTNTNIESIENNKERVKSMTTSGGKYEYKLGVFYFIEYEKIILKNLKTKYKFKNIEVSYYHNGIFLFSKSI